MKFRKQNSAVIVLAIIGAFISGFSLLHHTGFIPGKFCDLSTTFNCDVVNRGPFSEIAGIPVALIGLIGYVLIVAGAVLKARTFLVTASWAGLAFTLYLTYLEAFVLKTYCPLCLASALTILAITAVVTSSLRARYSIGK